MEKLLQSLAVFSDTELRDLLIDLAKFDLEFRELLVQICQQKKSKADLMMPVVEKQITEITDCFSQHAEDDGSLSWKATSDYVECVNSAIQRTENAAPHYRARILLTALDEVLKALGASDDSYGNLGDAIDDYIEAFQNLLELNSATFAIESLHRMLKTVQEAKSKAERQGIGGSFSTLLIVLNKAIEASKKSRF